MRFANLKTIPSIAALSAVASLALPSLAGAQSYPSYAVASQQTIKGTITGFNGAYTVYVQDEKGYGDNIQLHDGTVINPTGLKLQEGMRVTIYGYPNGPVFQAYRIDAPYPNYGYGGQYGGAYGAYGGAYPYYGGYYGAYGYPYYGGYYGTPWYPLWGVGFGWFGGWPGYYGGWPGYYRGGYYRGGYYRGPGFYRGPVRGTIGAPVRGTFRAPAGGTFRGAGGGTIRSRPPR